MKSFGGSWEPPFIIRAQKGLNSFGCEIIKEADADGIHDGFKTRGARSCCLSSNISGQDMMNCSGRALHFWGMEAGSD